ncbi:SH3 domain-containing protein [Rhizobium paknamense]|uniref:SH3-like domain-containing protein n=1 Tax=Rhizobium paknamense TaxID=1206817 RepID=A0ABU0IA74_9HYPH|nr:SH3 domain-containing protein [Rhizobium paknamense]MDQ0455130.1 SH3-like domain-containing protein [Rhizobium paknamense]
MRHPLRFFLALALAGLCGIAPAASEAMVMRQKGRETGFPVPRFVSLRSDQARMRVGPSTDYPIRYVYHAKGLPLEILDEYGHWRLVRDSDGASGWMMAPLLSSRRTGLVAPWIKSKGALINLLASPSASARVVAKLQPEVRIVLRHCDGKWCAVSLLEQSGRGYLPQASVWGVYPGEFIE